MKKVLFHSERNIWYIDLKRQRENQKKKKWFQIHFLSVNYYRVRHRQRYKSTKIKDLAKIILKQQFFFITYTYQKNLFNQVALPWLVGEPKNMSFNEIQCRLLGLPLYPILQWKIYFKKSSYKWIIRQHIFKNQKTGSPCLFITHTPNRHGIKSSLLVSYKVWFVLIELLYDV